MALYDVKRYRIVHDGHRVEVELDRSLVVLNRAALFIDGRRVDQKSIFYGRARLYGEAPGGATVGVEVGSGLVGQMTRCVLLADGRELLLEPVPQG